MLSLFRKKKVALVLGGGSARGIAHIGVMRVLQEARIPIDYVVGTSIGAMVGAAYCVGVSVESMDKKARAFSWEKLFDPVFPKIGLIEGNKLEQVIQDIIENKEFSDARIPLAIVTTDIEKNEEIYFTSGDLKKLVRASCSWPGVFNPVVIDNRLLVDGGVKNSVPTKIAQALWPDAFIIAVDVGFCVKKGKIDNILQIMLQTFQIMGEELNGYQASSADIVIRPDLAEIDQISFNRANELIEQGAEAARQSISRIKKALRL